MRTLEFQLTMLELNALLTQQQELDAKVSQSELRYTRMELRYELNSHRQTAHGAYLDNDAMSKLMEANRREVLDLQEKALKNRLEISKLLVKMKEELKEEVADAVTS